MLNRINFMLTLDHLFIDLFIYLFILCIFIVFYLKFAQDYSLHSGAICLLDFLEADSSANWTSPEDESVHVVKQTSTREVLYTCMAT